MLNIKEKKGISLYLSIVIISVLMSALLILVHISVSQVRIISGLGNSVNAFYGADSGVERLLYGVYKEGYVPSSGDCPYSDNLGSTSYEVCSQSTTTVWSTGNYRNTTRRIELEFSF